MPIIEYEIKWMIDESAPKKKCSWEIWVGDKWVSSGWATRLADAEKDASRSVLMDVDWNELSRTEGNS